MSKVLIVDDENCIRLSLRELLSDAGYYVETAECAKKATQILSSQHIDIVLSDIILPQISGVELLKTIKDTSPYVQVILMTGEPNVETASQAVRGGAFDYLSKPVRKAQLLKSIANAYKVKILEDDHRRLVKENQLYQENLEEQVVWRTSELITANELLKEEVAERIQAEIDLDMANQQLREQKQHLRALASKLSLTEEYERRKLAADLHDSVGQTLAYAQIRLEMLNSEIENKKINDSISEITDIVEKANNDAHTLIVELSPPVLHELGIESAIEWQVEQMQEQYGLKCIFNYQQDTKEQLDTDRQIALFRAMRELLINTAKHAKATCARISIERDDSSVSITTNDDGVGFDPMQLKPEFNKNGGFGLFNVRERMGYFGGKVDILSEPGDGARIKLTMPFG